MHSDEENIISIIIKIIDIKQKKEISLYYVKKTQQKKFLIHKKPNK